MNILEVKSLIYFWDTYGGAFMSEITGLIVGDGVEARDKITGGMDIPSGGPTNGGAPMSGITGLIVGDGVEAREGAMITGGMDIPSGGPTITGGGA
jgi:hypothetical protein